MYPVNIYMQGVPKCGVYNEMIPWPFLLLKFHINVCSKWLFLVSFLKIVFSDAFGLNFNLIRF